MVFMPRTWDLIELQRNSGYVPSFFASCNSRVLAKGPMEVPKSQQPARNLASVNFVAAAHRDHCQHLNNCARCSCIICCATVARLSRGNQYPSGSQAAWDEDSDSWAACAAHASSPAPSMIVGGGHGCKMEWLAAYQGKVQPAFPALSVAVICARQSLFILRHSNTQPLKRARLHLVASTFKRPCDSSVPFCECSALCAINLAPPDCTLLPRRVTLRSAPELDLASQRSFEVSACSGATQKDAIVATVEKWMGSLVLWFAECCTRVYKVAVVCCRLGTAASAQHSSLNAGT